MKHKAYVDESGQDTHGRFFVVSVVVTTRDSQALTEQLLRAEILSRRFVRKWNKSKTKAQEEYFEQLSRFTKLKNVLYYKTDTDKTDYLSFTALVTVASLKSAIRPTDYADVYVDGFRKTELHNFSRSLRLMCNRIEKVRTIRKEETNVFMRLADATCGLIRQAHEGNPWAKKMLKQLQQRTILKSV